MSTKQALEQDVEQDCAESLESSLRGEIATLQSQLAHAQKEIDVLKNRQSETNIDLAAVTELYNELLNATLKQRGTQKRNELRIRTQLTAEHDKTTTDLKIQNAALHQQFVNTNSELQEVLLKHGNEKVKRREAEQYGVSRDNDLAWLITLLDNAFQFSETIGASLTVTAIENARNKVPVLPAKLPKGKLKNLFNN